MERSKCRSCGAEILWVRSAKTGMLMPLNAEPSPQGDIGIIDDRAHIKRGDLFEQPLPEGPRYVSHFATCPEAAKWRKKKAK